MYALVGQEQPGRSAEQAERDTRIRDIVLDFATGEQTRLWPAVTDRPTSGSVGNPPFEATPTTSGPRPVGGHRPPLTAGGHHTEQRTKGENR